MESTVSPRPLVAALKAFGRRLLVIGENRLELLMVELQEERERCLRVMLLVCGVAAFGLLAGMTFTAAIVIWLRASPVAVLLVFAVLYGAAAVYLWWRIIRLLRDWQTLSGSLEQLQKDRTCLEKILT
jgi:uncharacterized membrane protein YqjE